jgi:hypothetical protein
VTLRIAAVLALLLGVGGLLGYLRIVGKGPFASLEERHRRDMKDRSLAPASITPFTFADFRRLPHGLTVAEYSGLERRGVSLEGYAQFMLTASDGDYHLEIADAPPGTPGYDPDYVTGEITPAWSRSPSRWRFEALIASLRPDRGGTTRWDGGPRRARFSGWLLYDSPYDLPISPRHRRLTGWEIHPITRIEVWNDQLARFVELAR